MKCVFYKEYIVVATHWGAQCVATGKIGGSFELSGSCLDSRRDKKAGGQGTVPEYDLVTKLQNCERDEGKKVEEYMEYTLKLF
mgnify:CR=1 FL=1